MVGDVFSILTVCTGNICRSPLGEQLLAQQLADLADVRVASAGTGALVGHGMPDQSLAIARSLGVVDPESHVSRQLTPELLDESDVVFAMAREHRRAIVELNPRVSKRVFTLREFARLADATSDDDLRAEFAPGPLVGMCRRRRWSGCVLGLRLLLRVGVCCRRWRIRWVMMWWTRIGVARMCMTSRRGRLFLRCRRL